MSDWPYPNFTKAEVTCKCGCGMLPKAELMESLQGLRTACGFPFPISSGARCPKHNAKVSASGDDGPHTEGLAVDITANGTRALRIVSLATKHGFSCIGVSQKGAVDKRFIHLDKCQATAERPRPWLYSY